MVKNIKFRIRIMLVIFIIGLGISCQAVIFVRPQLAWFKKYSGPETFVGRNFPSVSEWVSSLHEGFTITYETYPFIEYCMLWLAFAHIVLIIMCVGVVKNPVRNIWIVQGCMISCIMLVPTVLLLGPVFRIPLFHCIIDGLFGLAGIIPLGIVYRDIKRLSEVKSKT